MLKPVAVYRDSSGAAGDSSHAAIVMCEVMLPDGDAAPEQLPAPASSDDPGCLVRLRAGVLPRRGRPSPRVARSTDYPEPAGRVLLRRSATAPSATSPAPIVEEHFDALPRRRGSTTRASTPRWPRASGSSRSSVKVRLHRGRPDVGRPLPPASSAAEKYGVDVEWHCKPFTGDWNGSGMHCQLLHRDSCADEGGGKDYFEEAHGRSSGKYLRRAHRRLRPGERSCA